MENFTITPSGDKRATSLYQYCKVELYFVNNNFRTKEAFNEIKENCFINEEGEIEIPALGNPS